MINAQQTFVDYYSTGKNNDGTLMSAPPPDVTGGTSVLDPDWTVVRPGETTPVTTKTRHTYTGWSFPVIGVTGNTLQSRWITDKDGWAKVGDYYYYSNSFQIPNVATDAKLNLRSISFVRNWTYLVRTDVTPNTEELITQTTWMSDGAKGWLNSRSPEVINKQLVPGATYKIKVRVYTNNTTVTNALNVHFAYSYNEQACSTPMPVINSPVIYCQNTVASPLTATGNNLLWYTVASGGIGSSVAPTPSTNITGTTSYYVSQTENGCESARAKIDINVNYPAIVSLTSGSDNQNVDVNNSIQPIVYTFNNIAGVNINGLPNGVTSSVTGNTLTITGTPTVTGVFNYSITTNGGCSDVTANGKIEVLKDWKLAPNSYIFDIDYAKANNVGGIKIPVRKAYEMWGDVNGYLDEQIPNSGVLSASVYWQDVPDLIRSVSLEGEGKDSQIKVMIDKSKGEGNAVIAFKVDDSIYWSWHIWVTDNPEDGSEFGHVAGQERVEFYGSSNINCENCPDSSSTFFTPKYMDRNLGAINKSFLGKDWNKSGGLLYQWGRKDPIPPLIYKDDTYYEISGESGVFRHSEASFKIGAIAYSKDYNYERPINSTVSDNIRFSVKNPLKPIYNSSDYTTKTWFNGDALTNLWSDNSKGKYETNANFYSRRKGYLTKSYYDPCPNGWRLPSHSTANPWDDSTNKGIKLKYSPWGIDDEINTDDFYNNKNNVIKPNDGNNYVKGVKIYSGLGMVLANVNGLDMGTFPGTGKINIYSSNKNFQDTHEVHLWSATMENNSGVSPYAKSFSLYADPAQTFEKPDAANYPSLIGKYEYNPNSNSNPTMATGACRCMKDPLFEIKGYNFSTEFVTDDVINYTDGIDNPNSYLITKNSQQMVMSIPVNKAFSVYNQYLSDHQILNYDNLKANVYWTTNKSLISNIKVDNPSSLNANINVTIEPNQSGNALISLHNGSINNPIYWTWHIWVTNDDVQTFSYTTEDTYLNNSAYVNWSNSGMQPKTNVFMDRNLGALNALPAIAGIEPTATDLEKIKNSGGMQYQWGRKDPIPTFITPGYISSGAIGTPYEIYRSSLGPDINGNLTPTSFDVTINSTIYLNNFTKNYSIVTNNNTDKIIKIRENLKNTVQNPLMYIYQDLSAGTNLGKDWLINEPGVMSDRWGHAKEKSIFDPCPSGWRVPDFGGVSTNPNYRKGNSPWYNGYYSPSGADSLVYQSLGINEGVSISVNQNPDTTSPFYYGKAIRSQSGSNRYGLQFDNPEIIGNPNTKFKIGNLPFTGIRGLYNTSGISYGYIGMWSAALNGNMQGFAKGLYIGRVYEVKTGEDFSPYFSMNVRCVKVDENMLNNKQIIVNNSISESKFDVQNEKLQVSPNPFSDSIIIRGIFVSYILYDVSGKVLLIGDKSVINTSNLNKGVYLLKIILENGENITKKIIKK